MRQPHLLSSVCQLPVSLPLPRLPVPLSTPAAEPSPFASYLRDASSPLINTPIHGGGPAQPQASPSPPSRPAGWRGGVASISRTRGRVAQIAESARPRAQQCPNLQKQPVFPRLGADQP